MEKTEGRPERNISLYEEDIYEKKDVKEKTLSLMVLRLSAEWYCVNIERVREVIKLEKITYLPCAPEHVAGIIQLRGNILSVTDLKKIFALPPEDLTKKARLVIVSDDRLETGLLVDEVTGIIEVPISQIEPPLSTIPAEAAEYIEGECKLGRRLFGLLNVQRVLESKSERVEAS